MKDLEEERRKSHGGGDEGEGEGGRDGWSVGGVTMAITEHLIHWAIVEVCIEEHGAFWKENQGGDPLVSLLGDNKGRNGVYFVEDEEGDEKRDQERSKKEHDERKKASKNVNVVCSNCNGSIAASRYAQHLEKCLGRGGRSSSRAASQKLKNNARKAEKEDEEMDDGGKDGKGQSSLLLSRSGNGGRRRRTSNAVNYDESDDKDEGEDDEQEGPNSGSISPVLARGRFGSS